MLDRLPTLKIFFACGAPISNIYQDKAQNFPRLRRAPAESHIYISFACGAPTSYQQVRLTSLLVAGAYQQKAHHNFLRLRRARHLNKTTNKNRVKYPRASMLVPTRNNFGTCTELPRWHAGADSRRLELERRTRKRSPSPSNVRS